MGAPGLGIAHVFETGLGDPLWIYHPRIYSYPFLNFVICVFIWCGLSCPDRLVICQVNQCSPFPLLKFLLQTSRVASLLVRKDLVRKFSFTLLLTDVPSHVYVCDPATFVIADEGSRVLKLTFALLAASVTLELFFRCRNCPQYCVPLWFFYSERF